MNALMQVGLKMCKKYFLLGVAFAFLTHCKSQLSTELQSENDNHTMKLVLKEAYSGFKKEQLVLIQDQKKLEQLFGVINRTRKPGIELPVVNFENEMLVVWCGGETSKEQPSLDLIINGEEILVTKRYTSSKKKTENVITSPIQIYKLPKSGKSLLLK